jgi:hypothetical protein
MSLSLYDWVTNVLCVSLSSHDRYQYNNAIRSKHTGACTHQLLWRVALDRLRLQEVDEQKMSLIYPHKKKITRR